MLSPWPLLCDSVIIVRSRKILLKELSCWRGGGCRDFNVGGRHALDEIERQGIYQHPISLEAVSELKDQNGYDVTGERDLQVWVVERELVRKALVQLAADQRRVVALRYGADLTEVDIAQVLGWPVGTVKSRLNRARDRLRLLLADERE